MQELIDHALTEDLGTGDVTSEAVVPADALARARIDQKAEGVIAGLQVAEAVFRRVDPELRWHARVAEGVWREGGLVAEVAGPARSLLGGERVALNFLGRLSGVATLTARYVRAIEGTGARILDTRKTTPGLRTLEKQAVVPAAATTTASASSTRCCSRRTTRRWAAGWGRPRAARWPAAPEGMRVEVECATLDEVDEALAAGATSLLLDNMEPRRAAARRWRTSAARRSTEARAGSTWTRCARSPRRAWTGSASAR